MEHLAIIAGPIIGLVVVVAAYCLGVYFSIKCCQPDHNISVRDLPFREAAEPNLDIFIVSRSEDYLVSIPRPTFINLRSERNNLEANSNPAPEYEGPPSYEDCLQNGLISSDPAPIQDSKNHN